MAQLKSLGAASRFAVLKVEDDFSSDSDTPSTSIKKSQPVNQKANASQEKSKSKKKKKGPKNGDKDLLSIAFVSSKSKNKNTQQKTNGVDSSVSDSQWEQWKKKDSNFVAEAYESDLSQALLLSKIDYEEKKDVYECLQKEAEESKLVAEKKKKKGSSKKEKGASTMSLEKFHNLLPCQIEAICSNDLQAGDSESIDTEVKIKRPSVIEDDKFFDTIKENAAKIIREETHNESSKKTRFSPEYCRSLQYEDALEKKQDEVDELKKENEELKEELKKVKRRNKQLCHILGQGEMSEKAEILLQMDELNKVKNELTEQISEQHTALEQEKSKVHSLQVELRKFQGRKEHRESR